MAVEDDATAQMMLAVARGEWQPHQPHQPHESHPPPRHVPPSRAQPAPQQAQEQAQAQAQLIAMQQQQNALAWQAFQQAQAQQAQQAQYMQAMAAYNNGLPPPSLSALGSYAPLGYSPAFPPPSAGAMPGSIMGSGALHLVDASAARLMPWGHAALVPPGTAQTTLSAPANLQPVRASATKPPSSRKAGGRSTPAPSAPTGAEQTAAGAIAARLGRADGSMPHRGDAAAVAAQAYAEQEIERQRQHLQQL